MEGGEYLLTEFKNFKFGSWGSLCEEGLSFTVEKSWTSIELWVKWYFLHILFCDLGSHVITQATKNVREIASGWDGHIQIGQCVGLGENLSSWSCYLSAFSPDPQVVCSASLISGKNNLDSWWIQWPSKQAIFLFINLAPEGNGFCNFVASSALGY